MRSTIAAVTREFDELRALVGSIVPVNDALAGHAESIVHEYLSVRRRFDYAAFVVALYASFESFVEQLVASYAQITAAREPYLALPGSLTRKHLVKTAEILARGNVGEGRYAGLRESELVRNLHECLTGATPYRLNEVAITSHDWNLRHDEVGRLFNAVGVESACDRARDTDVMISWYCEANSLDSPPEGGVPIETVRERTNDLVERRNRVAHRGGTPDDLLGPDDMIRLLGFADAFSRGLFAVVVSDYLHHRHVKWNEAGQLVLREGPYQDGSVVVVEAPERRLFVDQPIFAFVRARAVRYGRVVELRINDQAVQEVSHDLAGSDVGIRVDFKCPKDVQLYVLDRDDDLVWRPQQV